MQKHVRTIAMTWFAMMLFLNLGGSLPRSAHANTLGNAVVAAPCGEAEFIAALNAVQSSGGGTITFACGNASIPFTTFKNISSNVVIDGAGAITLDGQQATRFFMVVGGAALTLRQIVLTDGNSGNDYGGAVYVHPGGTLALEQSAIRNSTANGWAGGAIIDFQGTVTLTDSVIEGNQSSYGALNSTGALTLIRTTVRNNTATVGGGGLSVGGAVTIQESLLEGNVAAVGGALYVTESAAVTIDRSHFLLNLADAPVDIEAQGGAIISYGDLRISGATFEANRAEGFGGAIAAGPGSNDAFTQIANSTFVANEAGERGGAIDNDRGRLEVVNSTFSANRAAAGGAIQNFLGPANLYYVTLADNDGGLGGVLDQHAFAGYVDDSRQRFNLYHTALAGAVACAITDTPGPQPHFVSGGYNLSADNSCAFFLNQTGDVNNTPAQLGALADNGGATWTYLPAAGSPLIDAAPCLPDFAADQRGVSRPQGAQCDIGAVEVQPTPPTATPTHTPTRTPTSPPPTATRTATPTATSQPTASPGPGTPTAIATATGTATASPAPVLLPADTPVPTLHPAQIPGGVSVTINVAPNRAYAGQMVEVSGQGAPGYAKVRILSVQGGRTVGSSEAPVDGQGAYKLNLRVPPGQPVGPTQLCAAPVGAANAQLACTAFQVDMMPPGQVQGQISGAGALNAQINLVDRLGRLRYTAPVNASGGFQLAGIDPGVYRTIVTGQSAAPVAPGQVVVLPNRLVNGDLSGIELHPGAACSLDPRVSAYLQLKSDQRPAGEGGSGATRWPQATIVGSVGELDQQLLGLLANDLLRLSQRDHFGVYLAGVPRGVVFVAYPQTDKTPDQVRFRLVDVDGRVVQEETENLPPYEATLRVGDLSPSAGGRHPQIQVVPIFAGSEGCPSSYPVHVMADPANLRGVKPFDNRNTIWNADRGRYEFYGFIPNAADISFSIPQEPLPFFGAFQNTLRAGVIVAGWVYEDGRVEVRAVYADALVRALSVKLYENRKKLDLPQQPLGSPWQALRNLRVDLGSFDLVAEDSVGLPFTHAPVLDLFGLIQVHVATSGDVTYGIKMGGYAKPFAPEIGARVTASAGAQGEIGYGLGVIGGIAAVGYSLGLGAALDVPVDITVLPNPDLNVPEVCFRINAFARAWAQYLWGIKLPGANTNPSYKRVLAEYPLGCLGPFAARSEGLLATPPVEDAPLPALFASPSVASSADGRVLAAYVEDRAVGDVAQVQIMARFQDGATGQWLAPAALSDPAHSAVNPVALFAGPNALPVVAWAEMPYDAATAATLGDDMNAHLRRQEIFYTVFENNAWSAPIRLTDDLLGDGMPTGAGNSSGALLAWTRDTDADFATRGDRRIAVAVFNPNTARFLAPQFLTAPAGGMNADVRVALAPNGVRHLVWVNDADANLLTADDRRIAWATAPAGAPGAQPTWAVVNPQPLPPRVDSPALNVGPAGLELAFLVRQPEAGVVPLLGPNGALWTGTLAGNQWQAAPLLDESGGLVFAEQPVLAGAQGESLLAFRRFTPASLDNGALGQISLARRNADGSFTAPIYVTDAPQENWQPALTINPVNREAVILKVARPQTRQRTLPDGSPRTAIRTSRAILAANAGALTTGGFATPQDPVEFLVSAPTADPALDPPTASASVLPAGAAITVSVTLRNVGRDAATGMTVTLYQGAAGSGVALDSRTVAGPLPLNATAPLTFVVAATGNAQPLYAQVTSTGGNGSTGNDLASLILGIPSVPLTVTVAADPWHEETLSVLWAMPEGEWPAGYRVLRGAAPAGPFELVGESAAPDFTDMLASREQTYCYVVQAHNGSAFSPLSEPACGALEMLRVYLPAIER
jgi:predicted outer membrane repeat protein